MLASVAEGGLSARRARAGRASHGPLPLAGNCAGSLIETAVAVSPFWVSWALTWSPTLIPLMLETRPVNRVELVTVAVMLRPGPPIVIDVPLTAVTWPAMNISTLPWPGPPPPPGPAFPPDRAGAWTVG
jgi:hypothetical protein